MSVFCTCQNNKAMAKSKLARMNAKYSVGGKPIGSTGLFAKGGKIKVSSFQHEIKKDGKTYVPFYLPETAPQGIKNLTSEELIRKFKSGLYEEYKPNDWIVVEIALSKGLKGKNDLHGNPYKPSVWIFVNKEESFSEGGKPIGSTGLFSKGGNAMSIKKGDLVFAPMEGQSGLTGLVVSNPKKDEYGITVVKVYFRGYNGDILETDVKSLKNIRDYMHIVESRDDISSYKSIAKSKNLFISNKYDDLVDKYSAGGKPIGSTGLFSKGGYTSQEGEYSINVHGEEPSDYKIVCKKVLIDGKMTMVCYHETNDKTKKGVEVYSGENYIVGSKEKSYSRVYPIDKVPSKYNKIVSELKEEHERRSSLDRFSDGGKPIGSTGLFAEGGSVDLPYKRTISLGKIAYYGKSKSNEVDVKVEVRVKEKARNWETLEEVENVPELSMSGGIWNNRKTDTYTTGQMLDELPKLFPGNSKIKRLVEIWEQYHLNDLRAGTKKQTEALNAWADRPKGFSYTEDSEYLKSIGLYDDRGYKYGHGWLYQPLPESIIKETIEIANSFPEFNKYETGGFLKDLEPEVKPIGSTGLFANGGNVSYDFDDWSRYDDEALAHDIELYAENNADLHRQRYIPILKNLKKRLDKGTFDMEKSVTLWKYYVEDADKRYQKEVMDRQPRGYVLSVNDRKLLAERFAHFLKQEYDLNKLEGYAKGGALGDEDLELLFRQATDQGAEIIEEFVDENNGFGYEDYYTKRIEEVPHKAVSGFIPFTDGGSMLSWFEYADSLIGQGKKLPTNTLQAELERRDDDAYKYAEDKFKEEYPEIAEELGDDKINYNDLNEEGYSSEAEELDEFRRQYLQDDSIMMDIRYYLYYPNNSRSKDGKPTCAVIASVNMEAPYHREGNMEDFVEKEFTFHNIDGFKNKLKSALEDVKKWFSGESYEKGRPLRISRMSLGGPASVSYADLPDPTKKEFDLGGTVVLQKFPMSTDNTLSAHAGNPLLSQNQSGI